MSEIQPRAISRKAFLGVSAVFVGSVAAGGCRRGGSGGGAAGNTFKYALQGPPTSFDPAKVEDGDTIDLLMQVFEGLVQWDPDSKIVGGIAEKWEISEDGTVYTFQLKPSVSFHNGRKLTAQDMVYSFTRAVLPATLSTTARTYLNDIVGALDCLDSKTKELKGVKAVDEHTLQITIDKRRPYFLAKLTYPTGYAVCKEAIEANNGELDDKALIGTGPFKLKTYQAGYSVTLAGNKEYHGGAPVLDGIDRRILGDSSARQTAYESGQTDLTDVQRADLARIQGDSVLGKEVNEFPRAAIWYLALNQQAFAPFKDKRVRQAFAHALNKDELIKVALKGTVQKAEGIVPPGVPGHNSGFKGLGYDPAKAKDLLASAGFAEGKGLPKLVISFRNNYQHIADGVLAIRNDLKQNLGIEVDVRQMDFAQLLRERNQGTMPCYHMRWAADYLDQQNFLSLMLRTGSAENTIGYSNPEFDRLCDEADVEADPVKRIALYNQAEAIAVDDAPWVCIYFQHDVELHKPYLKGIRPGLMGHLPHTSTTVAR